MSVFTTVTSQQLQIWLQDYAIGALIELKGIASGITNTNYFVTTASGRYVLTLFEHNSMDELPYFIDLMSHLAAHGVPCPKPIADRYGQSLHMLNGKPAVLISCLSGRDIETPTESQCAEVGAVLARMHLVGQSFKPQTQGMAQRNPRDSQWRKQTAQKVMPHLDVEEHCMLQAALEFQEGLDLSALPCGVIHADLFRDNVLFDGEQVGGLIDFYYACEGAFAYDLAITVNDWCIEADGSFDEARLRALLQAYQAVRPLDQSERDAWNSLLRIAALRFWLSRLYDNIFPQEGELTHAKDPDHFKCILQRRTEQQRSLTDV
ncbi:MAG: homoserine kinase [Betaproteobacteria bacterium]|nr:homoserine kinase [Betaproteobacteria bacterium]